LWKEAENSIAEKRKEEERVGICGVKNGKRRGERGILPEILRGAQGEVRSRIP